MGSICPGLFSPSKKMDHRGSKKTIMGWSALSSRSRNCNPSPFHGIHGMTFSRAQSAQRIQTIPFLPPAPSGAESERSDPALLFSTILRIFQCSRQFLPCFKSASGMREKPIRDPHPIRRSWDEMAKRGTEHRYNCLNQIFCSTWCEAPASLAGSRPCIPEQFSCRIAPHIK